MRETVFEVRVPNRKIGPLNGVITSQFVLGSNCITSDTPDSICMIKKKKNILISRADIVKLIQSMGGIDKHDQLVSFFRTFILNQENGLQKWSHRFLYRNSKKSA